jgi:hypothetical protein
MGSSSADLRRTLTSLKEAVPLFLDVCPRMHSHNHFSAPVIGCDGFA